MNHSDYDWFRFRVHFMFGAMLGAVMGGIIWMQNWYLGISPWLWIGGSSFVVALLGGIYDDRFWEWFLRNLRWFH